MDKISIRKAKNAIPGLLKFIEFINEQTPTKNLEMVEIGCYVGDSTYHFANNFKFVYCCDPFQLGYDENDSSSFLYPMEVVEKQFDDYLSQFDNYKKYKMPNEDAVSLFTDESLDLVYIDGNHQAESVERDILNWIPKVKKGMWIGGHDYGSKHHPHVKRIVDSYFKGQDIHSFLDLSWLVTI